MHPRQPVHGIKCRDTLRYMRNRWPSWNRKCKALAPASHVRHSYPFLDRVTLGVIPPFSFPFADPLA